MHFRCAALKTNVKARELVQRLRHLFALHTTYPDLYLNTAQHDHDVSRSFYWAQSQDVVQKLTLPKYKQQKTPKPNIYINHILISLSLASSPPFTIQLSTLSRFSHNPVLPPGNHYWFYSLNISVHFIYFIALFAFSIYLLWVKPYSICLSLSGYFTKPCSSYFTF